MKKMRKSIKRITVAVFCGALALTSLSCVSQNDISTPSTESNISAHEHDYEKTVYRPSCIEEGYSAYECECGDNYIADVVLPYHQTETGIDCGKCGQKLRSEGLSIQYALNNVDVTVGIGSCADSEIIIPSVFESTPVTVIRSNGFKGGTFTNIVIPNTVTTIQESAFKDCARLLSVEIPNSVTEIKNEAFYGCSNLTKVTLPEVGLNIGSLVFSATEFYNFKDNWEDGKLYGTLYIGKHLIIASNVGEIYEVKSGTLSIAAEAFYKSRDTLKEVLLPDSVKIIGFCAFENCYNITKLTLGSSVETIGGYAFDGCYQIKEITLGKNLKSIGNSAFRNCENLSAVNYMGTKADWNKIEKETEWNVDSGITKIICQDGEVIL